MPLPLTIGEVTFFDLEVPQKIGPFGGKQVLVVHEYPGGAKDVDSLGAFPHKVTWSGIFTQTAAFARAQALDRIRADGLPVTLNYGPQSYIGKVAQFEYNPSHQFLIPYSISFEPIADLSGVGIVPGGGESLETQLGDQVDAIDSIISGDDGLTLPTSLLTPATTLTTAVATGLLQGDGTVAGIPSTLAAAITSAGVAIQAAATPLLDSADPTQASPASDLYSRAAAVNIIVAAPNAAARQLRLINPNLFTLAAQYLGDPMEWSRIAAASGLSDPQPTGEFLITVPQS